MESGFLQKIQQYYTSPNKALFDELLEFQHQPQAWQCVNYLQDKNPYLKTFALSTIKYKCKFGLTTLSAEEQQALLKQLLQVHCFDGAALILSHHIEWLDLCPNVADVLSECALLDDFPPIQLSKYLPALSQHPMGVDTTGRLLQKCSIPLDRISGFLDEALKTKNFIFLTEVASVYFNSGELLEKLAQYAASIPLQELDSEELIDFIYMCCELGEANVNMMIRQPEKYSQFWNVLIQISGFPILHTSIFWSYISERLHQEKNVNFAAFVHIFTELIKVIFPMACYKADMDNQEKEDFRQHRKDITEILQYSFREIGDLYFETIQQFQGKWEYTEAKYFCIRSIGYDLDKTKEYPNLMTILHDTQFKDHPKVVYGKCLLTQTVTPYFCNNKEWYSTAIQWIGECAQILDQDKELLNAVLRSLSFLLDDAVRYHMDVLNLINIDMVASTFQAAWNAKDKEPLSNFCRCCDVLLKRQDFNQFIHSSILPSMLENLGHEPYCVLFLGLYLEFVNDPYCLQIVQKVLQSNISASPFLARFYRSAPKHAQSFDDLKTLITQLMGLSYFKGQIHALETIIQQGYEKCQGNTELTNEWNTLTLQVFEHLLTQPSDDAELENLSDCFQMLFYDHYQIYYNCNPQALNFFVTNLLKEYIAQTEIPENIQALIDWSVCILEIVDTTVLDLYHSTWKHKWSNVNFSNDLKTQIISGIFNSIPIFVFESCKFKYPTSRLRETAVMFIVVFKYAYENKIINELKASFAQFYDANSPTPAYRTQMQVFLDDMFTKSLVEVQAGLAETNLADKKRQYRRGVTHVLGALRMQKQWYDTLQKA
eukprot:NODE_13_length_54415_cov_0.522424.p2 type:complete len:826 gc:universal NODE_13_length_54415_cov_0.522424:40507-42984(+)